MALEFVLQLATDKDARSALCSLLEIPGFELEERDEDSSEDDVAINGPAVLVSAHEASTVRQSLVQEAFGFRPSVSVWFRIRPKDEYSEGKSSVLRATMALLHENSEDGVLLFNGEEIVLQRIGGRLVFNQEFSEWDRKQLDRVTASPYEVRKLASPFP